MSTTTKTIPASVTFPHFVEIHMLQFYGASLLNRDDANMAKRIDVGGVERIRISSQCLKRHWSESKSKNAVGEMGLPKTLRSRGIFEDEIVRPLIESSYPEKNVRQVVNVLMEAVLGKSEKAKKEKVERQEKKKKGKAVEAAEAEPTPASDPAPQDEAESADTKQIVVMGFQEVRYLREQAEKILLMGGDPEKMARGYLSEQGATFAQNLKSIPMGCGLSAAMFGRMATGDALSRCTAAINVAHAVSVHPAKTEADYFSAIDNLRSTESEGVSGHLNATELSSGLYYVYACVDVRQLTSNLLGCPMEDWHKKPEKELEMVGEVISRLVWTMATVSSGAKAGSTAPFSYASTMLVRMGDDQPYQALEAFLQPVLGSENSNLLAKAQQALADFFSSCDAMYGLPGHRVVASMRTSTLNDLMPQGNVPKICEWIKSSIVQKSVQDFK